MIYNEYYEETFELSMNHSEKVFQLFTENVRRYISLIFLRGRTMNRLIITT